MNKSYSFFETLTVDMAVFCATSRLVSAIAAWMLVGITGDFRISVLDFT